MNTWEMLARERKVSALIDALERHHGWTYLASAMRAEHWAEVAKHAGCKPPSAQTIEAVLVRLKASGKVVV